MDFNLQDYLRDMRSEARDDMQALMSRVDLGFTTVEQRASQIAKELALHAQDDAVTAEQMDGRLKNIEDTKKTFRWLGGALVIGAIGFVSDVLVNHLHLLK